MDGKEKLILLDKFPNIKILHEWVTQIIECTYTLQNARVGYIEISKNSHHQVTYHCNIITTCMCFLFQMDRSKREHFQRLRDPE